MVEIQEPPQSDEDEIEQSRMTLGEHLQELRVRLIRATVALVVFFGLAWGFRYPIDDFVQRPYRGTAARLNADLVTMAEEAIAEDPEAWKDFYEDGYPETRTIRSDKRIPDSMKVDTGGGMFIYYMKVCLYVALAVGGPYMLWEIWQFVAAGLYRHERRVAMRYFPYSAALFIGGILFGFFAMLPAALYFLNVYGLGRILWYQSADSYWKLVQNMTLALGAIFQLPVIMLALARLDLVQPEAFARYRGYMALGALVLAAVLTPPDPVTQMLMAGPMIVLYEVGIWVSKAAYRRRARTEPENPS